MSSPVTDSRGVLRGRCTSCNCSGYQGGTAGLKCSICTHPPGKHQNITPGFAAQTYVTTGSSRPSNTSDAHGGYSYQNPPETGPCSANNCNKPCYYDPSVGEFDYCSPSCRDKHLLPKEKKSLQDDLKAFEYQVKLPVSGGEKRGIGAHTAGGESEYQSTQASGGRHSYSSAVSSGSQATTRSSSSGRQTTIKVFFQKSPSNDIGLIVSEEIYRCDTFSGLLVLGFEYNTKAEYLITTNEVRVLDVITSLNDKKISPLTYKEEATKNRSCSLELKRWISLPQLKPLMDKAEFSNPTALVAVMNPKDYPNCSTAKGFGLGITSLLSTTSVVSVTANTPARFSRLEYGDEIIAYGFVKKNKLEIGKDALSLTTNLEEAAKDGKTLVLVVKRPVIINL
ncbi:uncharacterized protein LOC135346156 isoform X1 [Halichondria panicea]|uniref:uncharacterized protein LOC135346156 isoform X1 n=1 Tax=Halichondria panicea TaxID=6063 RepID=UPI00312B3569